jgi:hypothetical protein
MSFELRPPRSPQKTESNSGKINRNSGIQTTVENSGRFQRSHSQGSCGDDLTAGMVRGAPLQPSKHSEGKFEVLRTLNPGVISSLDDNSMEEQSFSSTPEQHLAARWDTRESLTPRQPRREENDKRRKDIPAPAIRSSDLLAMSFSKRR